MSTRNIVWLVAIVVVGVSAGFAFGFRWGWVAALIVVVVGEIVERLARAKRRRDKAATEV